MATKYSPRIVTDGLVWCVDAANTRSYPGTGSTWFDLVGGNHLTNSGATFVSASSGEIETPYFSFGGDGDNLETQTADIILGDEVTLCTWFKKTGSGTGSPRILETVHDGGAAAYGHAIAIDTDGSLRFWIDENTTTSDRFLTVDPGASFDADTIDGGGWHYAVWAYDGTTGSVYANGNLIQTGSNSTTGLDDIKVITVGAITDYGGTYSHSQHAFQGYVGVCQIYNKGLTAVQVKQNYNAHKGRFGK